ncbi:MAG: DUF3795 domain-containing protein [Clostridia bacterium]|nr:DUF3795 domain-containing protein [Clostridia bacterium]
MTDSHRNETAYCGLYCKDCIPSNEKLFTLVNELDQLLEELNFEKYAAVKSKRSSIFDKYDDFKSVLMEIKKIECKKGCFRGPESLLGCSKNCQIRECVIEKHLNGCWECEEYGKCSKLEKHKTFHPGLENNLDMIKEFGIDNWIDKRGIHYHWNK